MSNPEIALLMLGSFIFIVLLGFPIAFTLMAMAVAFGYYAYFQPDQAFFDNRVFYLLSQNTFSVMNNDVLTAVPLFLFMGYLIERANILDRLFHSLQIAFREVPGSMAVAALVTCALFATATGIVGAVVTLMGLLAFPAMQQAGYNKSFASGVICAGGTLGILIPPSVMLIVYGATAGVSVVQLYAGAFFPGIMLAGLYVVYVIVLAKLKPHVMPPLPEEERKIKLPQAYENLRQSFSERVIPALIRGLGGASNVGVSLTEIAKTLLIALIPAIFFAVFMGSLYSVVTAPIQADETAGLQAMGIGMDGPADEADENEEEELVEITASPAPAQEKEDAAPAAAASTENQAPAERQPAPNWYWWMLGIGAAILVGFYLFFSWARLEIFKMLLGSFFPLAVLILAVLGSIVFGLATPTEAAAVGAIGGALLAAAYRRLNFQVVKESVFLTGKTSAMVCWLFVGSSIFSAAFALLGGQELVEKWVLGLGLTPVQFLVLSQVIIFLLGWPLEWTEIIVIFMPIFIPLLDNFGIDPLFFGLLVALNLQTAFLSPPVAMSAFYLKGVAPPHVTLNQIFAGMLPFMGIQVIAVVLLYVFPGIGMWLPTVLYR